MFVYTIQPVVNRFDNRLDNRLYRVYKHATGYNRFHNQFYRVNGVLLSLDTSVECGSTRLGFGTVLFLIFINDLDTSVSSNVLNFADDTKLYRVVDNQLDGHMLQRDLDVLCK